MKTTSGISLDNAAVAATPKHLLQFAVDQRYDDYTSVDHAVWRFIMRQNIFFLKEYAHKVYFQGLLDTGISFERIPRIQEMNDILAKIGWGAVAVDGFIPPAAFMEFQAYKVLVIACDMRQIHHIEYTPAPDIVHEAAGHAPIIVDREYSNYLQRFGEVGAKAMSSKKDFELYQAIRHLSILKEQPNSDPKEVDEATKLFDTQGHQPHSISVQEAKRGAGDPLYGYYTMGKLMILKLRGDYQKKTGSAYSLQQFHDAFIQLGPLPLPLIRKAMLGNAGSGELF